MKRKLNAYLIAFEQELSFGSQLFVTAASEEEALDLVFEKIFHNQTIPAGYQVQQVPMLSFMRKVGLRKFFKAINKAEGDFWYI